MLHALLHAFPRDLRYAARTLRASPVFTAVAVFVLTLGTGAVTTVLSAAHAVALRPLPGVADPDAVVEVHRALPDGTGDNWVSYPLYRHLRDGVRREGVRGGAAAPPVADLAAWAMMPLTITAGGEAVAAQGTLATGNYFRVLGVRPALGRFFTPAEDGAPGAHPVVVLSHGFWTTRLGGDPGVVGRTVRVNGHALTVVGVAPPRFGGASTLLRTDAWVPMALQPQLRPGDDLLADPRPGWLQLVARVWDGAGGDGASRDAVRRELERLVALYAAAGHGPAEDRPYTAVRLASLSGLPDGLRGRVLGFAALLLGAAGLVLVVAGVNVAALLLARAVARRREMAVRLALGATRGRLVRQLLAEGLLLAALGGAGGVLVAWSATRLAARLPLPGDLPFALALLDAPPDARVLAAALAVALLTGLAFGLAPAREAARADARGHVQARLRDGTAGAGARRGRAQGALVAGQVAGSFVLLVAAGLFLRALDRGRRVDLGFDPSQVAVASFDLGLHGYDGAKADRFRRALADRLRRAPGVVAAAYARDLPLGLVNRADLQVAGSAAPPATADGTPVRFAEVGAGYFETLRLPVVAGREFAAADDERAPRVAVVNQAFVRRFWPATTPAGAASAYAGAVGRTFRRGGEGGNEAVTVVGVARDATYERPGEAPAPFVYFALDQAAAGAHADHAELLVRTSDRAGNPVRLAPALRAAVRNLDASLPAPAVTTLGAVTRGVLLPQRAGAFATGLLGGVALLLAAAGLYGLVAHLAARRAREIGVRLALGAGPGDVVRLVVGAGMRPVAAGLAAGCVLALGATRLLAAFLVGVSPRDAAAFAGGAAVLTAAALAASYLPARRAAAADPARVMRAE